MPMSAEAFAKNPAARAPAGVTEGGQFTKASQGDGYRGAKKGGATAEQVKELQRKLIALGFLSKHSGKNGGVDGLFGPKTHAAVRAWQAANGRKVTGTIDKSDRLRLTKGENNKFSAGKSKSSKTSKAKKPGDWKPLTSKDLRKQVARKKLNKSGKKLKPRYVKT